MKVDISRQSRDDFTNMEKKNLLLGAFNNYGWTEIAPFFNSYKLAGFENCDCVIFADNVPHDARTRLQAMGVKILDIPEKFLGGCINNYRFELFRDFLNDNLENYNLALCADVRDVIFQKDIFKLYDGEKSFLGVSIEDGFMSEEQNKIWFVARYGEKLHDAIKDERIICCGVIWGTTKIFHECISKIADESQGRKDFCDQVAENYLIYNEKLFHDVLVKSENSNGPVLTLALTDPKKIKLDANNYVLNGKGEIAAIVHQYDRKDFLRKMVIRKYFEGVSFLEKVSFLHPSDEDSHDRFGKFARFLMRHKKSLV